MNFPWIKRSVHQETLSRFQALTLEYQNYRRRNAEIQSSAYSAGQADACAGAAPGVYNLLRGPGASPVRMNAMWRASV